MAGRILRQPEVLARTGLGRSSIAALEKQNEFPKRVSLGARAVGWHEAEVEAWLASRPSTEPK